MNPPPASLSRIEGFDLARGVAILGMTVVHFMLVMTQGTPASGWSRPFLDMLDGRPAATFVILAGIGVTLMARKAETAQAGLRSLDNRLRRRGLFLLACGFLNLLIWQGDILRVYGVSLLLAPWIIGRSSRSLLVIAGGFAAVFCVLLFTMDYDKHWDWNAMTYRDLWTVEGLTRSLFYDGFRSVFPWTGLLIFGMWLGRWNWADAAVSRRAMIWGLAAMATAWIVSAAMLSWLEANPQPDLSREDAVALFGLISMPPLPLFLLSATGFALFTTGACTVISRRWHASIFVRGISATGRLAFTWYIAHVVIGLGTVEAFGWTSASHGAALATGIGFYCIAAVCSLLLLKRFRTGPLEWMLRKIG